MTTLHALVVVMPEGSVATTARIPAGRPSGLDGIQTELAKQKRLRAVVARDRFFEIGSPEGLSTLDEWLAKTGRTA